MQISTISDLPVELEIQTCTCRRRPNWVNDFVYSDEWNRPIHKQCMKPEQDQVIYCCADCEDYFISRTLRPSGPHFEWISSVIYIARNMMSKSKFFNIKDVFCDSCSAG